MYPPPEPQPQRRRYSVRQQARLDAEMYAKLEALMSVLHRKRAAILRSVMQWGLTHMEKWTIDPSIPNRPHLVHLLVDPKLLKQVQEAADAHGASVATWRQAMRQVLPEDFPASWRAGDIAIRSHDSGYYHRRFQLRLDPDTQTKLGTLMQTFDRSAAEIIRQLMTQATPAAFPTHGQLAAPKRGTQPCEPGDDGLAGKDTL